MVSAASVSPVRNHRKPKLMIVNEEYSGVGAAGVSSAPAGALASSGRSLGLISEVSAVALGG